MLVALLDDFVKGEKSDHEHLLSSDGLEQLTVSTAPDIINATVLTLNFLTDNDPRVVERTTTYPVYGGNLFYEANGLEFNPRKPKREDGV